MVTAGQGAPCTREERPRAWGEKEGPGESLGEDLADCELASQPVGPFRGELLLRRLKTRQMDQGPVPSLRDQSSAAGGSRALLRC